MKMKIRQLHEWNVTPERAREIQNELRDKIKLQRLSAPIRLVAGADVSYSRKLERCFAAVTVFEYPAMRIVEQCNAIGEVSFPYVPGYLSFREAPILLKALERLSSLPDLMMFDGQGIAHPRQMGLATHLGIILDRPTIGCAKTRLFGQYEMPMEIQGCWTELRERGKLIGAVLRTRDRVKPLFVSPGHKITLDEAIEWVLRTITQYRIPEPIRRSHIAVNQLRANYEN